MHFSRALDDHARYSRSGEIAGNRDAPHILFDPTVLFVYYNFNKEKYLRRSVNLWLKAKTLIEVFFLQSDVCLNQVIVRTQIELHDRLEPFPG